MFMQSQEQPLQIPATSISASKAKQRRAPMVPLSAFSPAFVAELDAYSHLVTKPKKRSFSEKTDGRLKVRKMKKPTVVTRRGMLRRGAVLYAKVMDLPLKEVTSMSELIAPGVAEALADAYAAELGEDAPSIRLLAVTLLYMARAMYPDDVDAHDRLHALLQCTAPVVKEMSEHNRDMLLSISPKRMKSLHELPETIMQQLAARLEAKGYLTMFDVAAGMLAVAMAILLYAPLRARNLAMLRKKESLFLFSGGGRVVFTAAQTKNGVAINQSIPAKTAELIQQYFEKVLPWASDRPDDLALFPGKHGSRDSRSMGTLISRGLLKWVGLPINPHLFRHLAAYRYLMRNPGDYEFRPRPLGSKGRRDDQAVLLRSRVGGDP